MSSQNIGDFRKYSVLTLVLSSILLCLAIAGLIMQASGTPWVSESDYDFDLETMSYDAQDWEECCELIYEMYQDGDDSTQQQLDTTVDVFSPLNTYLILIIIFSAVTVLLTLLPIPQNVKGSSLSIMGLAIMTTGIFLTRKFSISLGYYFAEISNLYGTGYSSYASFHLHVMVYFGGLVGLFAIYSGLLIVSKNINSCNYLSSELQQSKKFSTSLLLLCLMVYLVSPFTPIAINEYEQPESIEDGDFQSEEQLFPMQLLAYDDMIEGAMLANEYEEGDESDLNITTVASHYSTSDTLFLTLIWINLGILAIISMAINPRLNKYLEAITQLNILSIGVIIPATIFSILVYTGIPDIAGDSSSVSSTSFHANWTLILACILCFIFWITLLVKSHIPWWSTVAKYNDNVGGHNVNNHLSQQNLSQQQPVYELPNVYNNQNQQPPRF